MLLYLIILKPCLVPILQPVTVAFAWLRVPPPPVGPAVNPAAAADAYPTPSTLNVFSLPPAFH